MKGDPGYFGPQSMMWKVNKEITVLFGGARALLMHAAHPLIAAGARQTSFYQRDPWKRLIRTLSLQNSLNNDELANLALDTEESTNCEPSIVLFVNVCEPVSVATVPSILRSSIACFIKSFVFESMVLSLIHILSNCCSFLANIVAFGNSDFTVF